MASVTMKDVALRVGTSVTTVSNAYQRPDQLSPDLRAHILAVAEELGYAGPSPAGRALRSGRTGVCGCLFRGELSHAFSDPYSAIFLAGLCESLEQFNAGVLVLRAPSGSEATPVLERAAIDALVVSSTVSDPTAFERLRRRGVRIVATQPSADDDWVGIDDAAAAGAVAKHLINLGHVDVAVIASGAPMGTIDECQYTSRHPLPDVPETSYENRRVHGIWKALRHGPLRIVRTDSNTRAAGRRAAAHILDGSRPPSAVIALSDTLAFGVNDELHARGLTPGLDLSVLGFDDLPDAEYLGLTTIHQPIHEKGRLAGLLAMDSTYPQRQIKLPSRLIVRASTGPCRARVGPRG